jgi:hypothetical protein
VTATLTETGEATARSERHNDPAISHGVLLPYAVC